MDKVKRVCTVEGCDGEAKAHKLCAKHLKRWQRHGHTEQTRPKDWGKRESHSLYQTWAWQRRTRNLRMCSEWRKDFWQFVKDVGKRPSNDHKLQRIDETQPYSIKNFEWVKAEFKKLRSESKREYHRRYQRNYRKTIPGKRAIKNADLKKKFGMSLDDYDKIFKDQNGVCAICGNVETYLDSRTQKVFELAVDHCHDSKKIRGLLCGQCNTGLGCFKDSTDLLTKAVDYLNN